MKYILPPLPYAYDALEPHIDEATMEVHHNGHHQTYVDKLNEVMAPYPDLQRPVEELIASVESLPLEIQTEVRNNGGGHANHSLFWTLLNPAGESEPEGDLSTILEETFGSFETFREKFSSLAEHHFSNGWAWLCAEPSAKITLLTTKDHESPVSMGMTPLLVLDLWEHAYYLKHQNKRKDYITNFWKIVNWPEIAARWDEFKATGTTNREWKMAS